MKRQFLAQYAKFQLNSSSSPSTAVSSHKSPNNDLSNNIKTNGNNEHCQTGGKISALPFYRGVYTAAAKTSHQNEATSTTSNPTQTTTTTTGTNEFHIDGNTSGGSFLRRYAGAGHHHYGSTPPSNAPSVLSGLDRRHRSPDPPPRFNRGQSPLLLRKNLLELGGQSTGSPLMNRR